MKPGRERGLPILYLRFLLCVAIVLLVYSIAGFLALPPVAKYLLEKNLSEKLHRKVSIASIAINPYTLSFSIKGLTVCELNSTDIFFALDEFHLTLQGGSIVERVLILKEVKLASPRIGISRMTDGKFNFSDLVRAEDPMPEPERASPQGAAPATESEPAVKPPSGTPVDRKTAPAPFRFTVHNISIADGRVDFFDAPNSERHSVKNIRVELASVSNAADEEGGLVESAITARINESPISVVVRARPFSENPESVVDIETKNIDLPHYLAYLPPRFKFRVVSGSADAKARVTHSRAGGTTSLGITGEAVFADVQAVGLDDSKLAALPRVEISMESFEPLVGRIHLSRILLQSPRLDLWRDKDGSLNVQTLVESDKTEEADSEGKEKETEPILEVDEIEIAGGEIAFADRSLGSEFNTSLAPIDLKIKDFSNTPGARAALAFTAGTEASETISMEGSLSLLPFVFDGNVAISGISAAKYVPYYQGQILFDVKEGRMDLKTFFRVESAERRLHVELSGLAASLDSLKLGKKDETDNFLEIGSLKIEESALKLAGGEFTIGQLSVQGAKISAIREKNGVLNLQTLIPSRDPGAGETTAGESSGTHQDQWKFLVKKTLVGDAKVRFEDRMLSEPVSFLADRIAMEAQNLSLDMGGKVGVSLACRVNESGTVRVDGDIVATPFFADLKLSLRDVEVPVIRPYFPERLRMKLTGGKLSAAGNLLLGAPKGGAISASYTGEISLSDFSSVDKDGGEDFLKWKELDLKGVDIGSNPLRAVVKIAAVKDFFARVTISGEKKINVLEILEDQTSSQTGVRTRPSGHAKAEGGTGAKEDSAEGKRTGDLRRKTPAGATTAKSGPLPAIVVERITLHDGTIAFSDNFVKPGFHAQLVSIAGKIVGLSSARDSLADVNLRGKLYGSSPLEITGKIHPFGDDMSADLSVKFNNIDMTRWNPYARKYVGYTLEKGNLHLELKYVIVKKAIDLQNSIVFDRLTLGEKVESADATTLPVKFAISLLQDRNGEIRLGVPVKGDMDDPKFDLGQVIMGAIQNFLLKAVTAPFALLGALLPHGAGEIDRVEMGDASGKITEASAKKLETMAGILYDRPNLELDIQGCVEIGRGKEVLTRHLFDLKLRRQKLKEMMKKGVTVASIDQVTVDPEESRKYLKLAYEEEFPKEGLKKLDFITKTPPEEMENRLLATIRVTDDDLRSLAYEWAMKVKDRLLESGKIEPRRLFLLEPDVFGSTEDAKSKGNGVLLKLK